VEDYLVPAGATFSNDVTGTTPVDETVVKPQVRKPLPASFVLCLFSQLFLSQGARVPHESLANLP
jgi:hypothetical protein